MRNPILNRKGFYFGSAADLSSTRCFNESTIEFHRVGVCGDALPEGSPGGPRNTMISSLLYHSCVFFAPDQPDGLLDGVPRRPQQHYDFIIVIVIVVHFWPRSAR